MSCGLTTQILGNWCIGDSLPVINENFQKIEATVCSLSSNTIYPVNTNTVALSFENTTRTLLANIVDSSVTNAKLKFDEGNYGFRNKIINGSFDFWQRGTSFLGISPASVQYTADRWGIVSNGNTLNVSRGIFSTADNFPESINSDFFNPSFYLKMSIVAAPVLTNYPAIIQRIENARTLAGRKIAVSFYANCTSSGSTTRPVFLKLVQRATPGVISNSSLATLNLSINQWKKYEIVMTVPSLFVVPDDNSYLELNIMTEGSSGDLMITGVQVEGGNRSTAYEIRPLAVELELCQRFFEKSYDVSTDPGTTTDKGSEIFFCGNNTTDFKLRTAFKTTKRGDINSLKSLIYDTSTGTVGQCRQTGVGALNVNLDTTLTSTKAIVFKPAAGVAAGSNSILTWHYVADGEFY